MKLGEFDYNLLPEKIALHPLDQRDQSKLLVYKSGKIQHHTFKALPSQLPNGSLLFINDTQVIPARLRARKATGALIEIFLLNPILPNGDVSQVMSSKQGCTWECMIGNKKKWRNERLSIPFQLTSDNHDLNLELIDNDKNHVRFTWKNNELSFAEIIHHIGLMPLPPYLNRESIAEERYQTIYSKHDGAVAAPTAGLHFTDAILNKVKERGHRIDRLTLHVGAGTFKPVTVDDISTHQMHEERIIVSKKNIENLLTHEGPIIPVGTTSMRTLESLYWFGIKLNKSLGVEFNITKDLPYQIPSKEKLTVKQSMETILEMMHKNSQESISGSTGIYIYPGYEYMVCDGLVTNFHQPKSSLILLVAALIGSDWRNVYNEALETNYRFLSYGDSSLLLPNH